MTPDKILANNVPMQSNGFYSSHSALQHAAMLHALPLLSAAATQKNAERGKRHNHRLTVIEYGCADGNNSGHPMREVLELADHSSDVQLHFNDRPENDFTTLSRNVARCQWPIKGNRRVFISMVPQSFYEAVVPALSIDIGFSLACLHHLNHVDPRPEGQSPVDPERQTALRYQAKNDLRRFLKLRAEEIIPGGSLVLTFVGKASTGEENYPGPVNACRSALIDMVRDGLIPLEVASEFEVPTYNRTLEDVWETLKEVEGEWITDEVYEKKVPHPAAEEFAAKKRVDFQNLDSHRLYYGNTVVDWLMAVVGGYFEKMLRVGLGEKYRQTDGALLLDDWVKRTKGKFLEKREVEDVSCWFIYVRLTRFEER